MSSVPVLSTMLGAVRRPVVLAVMPLEVSEMLLAVIAWLMLIVASVPEALRMREPVVALSDRAAAIAMSPAVWVREKVPAKVAGRAVRAPVSLALR